jgi:broad specificity phosphatase PhoE
VIVSFIRHGSTAWNEQGRMQGRRDIPLSERGRAQVKAWRLPPEIDGANWVSSPLRRASETAELLCNGAPDHANALVEMDWGAWEGLTLDQIRDRYGGEYDRAEASGFDFRAPGGESPRDVQDRLRAWLARVAASPVPVVAVTHLGVLRVVLATATGWDLTARPPIRFKGDSLHRFALDERGEVTVVECNVPLGAG